MTGSKRCTKCGVVKPLAEFYKDARQKDGLQSHCKRCKKAYYKAYRWSAAGRAARARYKRSPKGRATQARADRQRAYCFPKKAKGKHAVNNAIRDGRLTPEPCEVCGAEPAQGHHEDYSKLLDVRWLCRPCHDKVHQGELVLST